MIPLNDYNPTTRFPLVTLLLIGLCVWIYFFVQPSGQNTFMARTADEQAAEVEWTLRNAAVPCELVQGRALTEVEVVRIFAQGDSEACGDTPAGVAFAPDKNVYLAALWSMFLNGGLLHLAGNMLYLWVFGNNIEDRLRHWWYTAFYLSGGLESRQRARDADILSALARPISTSTDYRSTFYRPFSHPIRVEPGTRRIKVVPTPFALEEPGATLTIRILDAAGHEVGRTMRGVRTFSPATSLEVDLATVSNSRWGEWVVEITNAEPGPSPSPVPTEITVMATFGESGPPTP